jgi:uncharacterized protein (TIGR02646 family)
VILVDLGAEPPILATVRAAQLAVLQAIVDGGRQPLSTEIKGYGHLDVRRTLWERQHKKCCYCEKEIEDTREDVEHHRPKAEANRQPGSLLKHGYWWLAFTWGNLFYSCPQCNQPPYKGVKFPLAAGSTPLAEGEAPPGRELPLLLDPALDNGVDHIEFVRDKRDGKPVWVPKARTSRGDWTIRVCGLDRDALLGRYNDHVRDHVMPVVEAVRGALRSESAQAIYEQVERGKRKLLHPRQRFVGLSYDALRSFVPDERLARYRLRWAIMR